MWKDQKTPPQSLDFYFILLEKLWFWFFVKKKKKNRSVRKVLGAARNSLQWTAINESYSFFFSVSSKGLTGIRFAEHQRCYIRTQSRNLPSETELRAEDTQATVHLLHIFTPPSPYALHLNYKFPAVYTEMYLSAAVYGLILSFYLLTFGYYVT